MKPSDRAAGNMLDVPQRTRRPIHPQMLQGALPPRRAALTIALVYLLLGATWILSSDLVVNTLFSQQFARRWHVQTLKGWFYIALTSALLYFLIRRTYTAVRASAEARRETERLTRMLTERVRDYAIFTLNNAGNVTSWNRGAEQITGWTEAEILGRHIEVFYPTARVAEGRPQRDLKEAAERGWTEDEAPRVRRSGTEFFAAAQVTSIRDENDQPAGFLCVLRDVTERRRQQQALRQANQMLTAIIDAAPLPIISLDHEDRVAGWNHAAERLFGWSSDEVMGKPPPTIPDGEQSEHRHILARQLAGERVQGLEVVRKTKRGDLLQLSLWTAPLVDPAGHIIGAMGIFADLTDRKRAEEQVRQLNETLERRVAQRTARLEEANEELQAFSYTVSHDLRIPLRSLQHISRGLLSDQGEKLDDKGRSDALRLIGAAARMERQIEDLLEYARLSRSQLNPEPISLVLVVHELLGRLERDDAFRAARIAVQEPLGWVMGHRLTLQQVIQNLLTNAITFVRPGTAPSITISSTEHNGHVRLCIEDNGIGIEAEDRQQVFELFERLPAADDYPGAGVGLTIARRGVERMGGTISYQPSPTGGTIFCIELPKPPNPVPASANPPAPAPAPAPAPQDDTAGEPA